MRSKSLRKSGMRLCGDLCHRASPKIQGQTTAFSYQGSILPSDGSQDEISILRSSEGQ
jgi:hypothetical protein